MNLEENLGMYPEAIRKHLTDVGHLYRNQMVSLNKFCDGLFLEILNYRTSLFNAPTENDFPGFNNRKEIEKTRTLCLSIDKLSPVIKKQYTPPQQIVKASPIVQNADTLENDLSSVTKLNNDSVSNSDVKEARSKRNASKIAVANINKQVNQNLNSKLRRPNGNSSSDGKVDESSLIEVANGNNKMRISKTNSGSTVTKRHIEIDECNKENISNAGLNQDITKDEKSSAFENSGIRRSTRNCSTTIVKQELLMDDREIMPPPLAPLAVGRVKRTKTRKARNTQPLTYIKSESDSESSPPRERSARTSKQTTSTVSDQPDNNLSEMNISLETSVVKNNSENSEAKLNTRGSKTRACNRQKTYSVDEVDWSLQEVHEISSDTETVLLQSDKRPKRTKAKKNQKQHIIILDNTLDTSMQEKMPASNFEENEDPVDKVTSENVTDSGLIVKPISQRQNNSSDQAKLVQEEANKDEQINGNIKNSDTELPHTETRPKRTKARKYQKNRDDEDDAQSNEREKPVDVSNEKRSTRTKTRKIQKQQQVDLDESSTLEGMAVQKMAEIEVINSQLASQNSTDSDLTYASSRPKRTRKVNKESQKQPEQCDKNEGPKPIVEPVQVDTTEEAFHDAKDNTRDPSFVSSPIRNSMSSKRPLDGTTILNKYSKKIKVSCDKTEHLNDQTYICKDQPKSLNDETVVLSKPPAESNQKNAAQLNQTVVIEPAKGNSYDTSLLTDDNSEVDDSPPKLFSHTNKIPTKYSKGIKLISPVKQRVQQFERMAANNKAAADNAPSATTRNKSKNVVANSEVANSSKRTRSNIVTNVKSFIPSNASKKTVASTTACRRNEREQEAGKKKDAILQAKRMDQKQKREMKEAAAAATRDAAAKEREQAAETARQKQEAATQRSEQRAQINKKRQELERKVAESEERKRLEEEARIAKAKELELEQQRIAEEKRKQLEEKERKRKEALAEEKKRQAARQEFIAKQNEEKRQQQALQQPKSKSKANTPLKTGPAYASTPLKTKNNAIKNMTPTTLTDGFEYLVLGDNNDRLDREIPSWSRSDRRNYQLHLQRYQVTSVLDSLFMVKRESPRLEEIFPNIDKNTLKRTSSAMWKTPPRYSLMPQNKY